MSIRSLHHIYDVSRILREIADHPGAWNRYTDRTKRYNTPHADVQDIWVRFNDWKNYDGTPAFFQNEHESSWYPVSDELPSVKSLVFDVMHRVHGERLGGVLITRIPPGGKVLPHIDTGWHASHYEKFAVQLIGNEKQAFCFEDAELRPSTGELYTFDNSKLHWVINDSDEDRMTLIICIRRQA